VVPGAHRPSASSCGVHSGAGVAREGAGRRTAVRRGSGVSVRCAPATGRAAGGAAWEVSSRAGLGAAPRGGATSPSTAGTCKASALGGGVAAGGKSSPRVASGAAFGDSGAGWVAAVAFDVSSAGVGALVCVGRDHNAAAINITSAPPKPASTGARGAKAFGAVTAPGGASAKIVGAESACSTVRGTETTGSPLVRAGGVSEVPTRSAAMGGALTRSGAVRHASAWGVANSALTRAGRVGDALARVGAMGSALARVGAVGDALVRAATVGDALVRAATVGGSLARAGPVADALTRAGTVGDEVARSGAMGGALPGATDSALATANTKGGCASSATTTSVNAGTSAGGARLGVAGSDGAVGSAVPHDWQNCESASLIAWHPLQNLRSSPAPHWLQNRASDGFGWLQRKQNK